MGRAGNRKARRHRQGRKSLTAPFFLEKNRFQKEEEEPGNLFNYEKVEKGSGA